MTQIPKNQIPKYKMQILNTGDPLPPTWHLGQECCQLCIRLCCSCKRTFLKVEFLTKWIILELTFRLRPRLHVFGHIHESYGSLENRGTLYVNASSRRPRWLLVACLFVVACLLLFVCCYFLTKVVYCCCIFFFFQDHIVLHPLKIRMIF